MDQPRNTEISYAVSEALLRSSWSVDCIKIELIQRCEGGASFSGVGRLYQDEDGQLRYKIYASKSTEVSTERISKPRTSGKLVPDADYYDLSAEDTANRVWKAYRIWNAEVFTYSNILIVEGYLGDIACEAEIPKNSTINSSGLSYICAEGMKIPLNAEHTYVAGNCLEKSISVNCWKFKAMGHEFLLFNDENQHLNISVYANKGSFPENFAMSVLGALFFVLGRPINPIILKQRMPHETRCTLYSRRHPLRNVRHKPPLYLGDMVDRKTGKMIEVSEESHNDLFRQFLKYNLSHQEHWTPLWSQLQAVYDTSSNSYIDAYALTLSVSIESILKDIFSDVDRHIKEKIDNLDKALEYLDIWTGDCEIKERIKKAISGMKKLSTAEKLRQFEEQGVIFKGACRSWNDLRNRNAHRFQYPSLPSEKNLSLLFQATTLFYQLIFHAIGYRGAYTDFSVEGSPVCQYPKNE